MSARGLPFTVPAREKTDPIHIMPIVVFFGLFYMAAVFSGHWQSTIPPDTVKPLYKAAGTFAHP
jgi:hypothetical protein